MKTIGKQARTKATPGFAIEIRDDADLGNTILIAEMEGGCYQWVGAVVSINQGREIAPSYMRCRMNDPERGVTPACPGCYLMQAQGMDGDFRVAKTIRL